MVPPTNNETEEKSFDIQDYNEPTLVNGYGDDEGITLNTEDLEALNIRRNRNMEFFKKCKDEGRSIEHTYDLFASGYLCAPELDI